MKVLALLCLALGSVSARGSGPYLPSGWRPDGPAFYLPTKQPSTDNPLKDLILHGSGSDSLREYGPPKESQEVIKQDLPSENVDVTFTSAEKLQEESLNGSEASATDALREYGPPKVQQSQDLIAINSTQEVTEQVLVENSYDVIETSTLKEEEQAVTEPQVIETTTLQAEVPILSIPADSESIVVANSVETVETDGTITENVFPAEVKTTTSDVQNISVETDISKIDDSSTNVSEHTESNESHNNLAAVKVELEQTVQQIVQNSEQSIDKISENVVEKVEKVEEIGLNKEQSEQNDDDNHKSEQGIQHIEESPQTVIQNIRDAEDKTEENEHKKDVIEVVQNIPEDLTYVNNDITQQIEKSENQNEEQSYPQSGSLEQAPEGFLEYGPPGFQEYGPPKEEDLARATAEEIISEAESFESSNETRRRRFSPKFKPTN